MLLRVPILQMARLLHIGDAQKRIPPSEDAARPTRRFEVEDFAKQIQNAGLFSGEETLSTHTDTI